MKEERSHWGLQTALWGRELALTAQLVGLWGFAATHDWRFLEVQVGASVARTVANFTAYSLGSSAEDNAQPPLSVVADLGWLLMTSLYMSEVVTETGGVQLNDAAQLAYPVVMTMVAVFSGLRGLQEEG